MTLDLQCKNCGHTFTATDSVECPQCGAAAPYKLHTSAGYWVVGWNMPGYLPDMDPATFADFTSAKAFLADQLTSEAEELDDMALHDDEQVYTARQRDAYAAEAEELRALRNSLAALEPAEAEDYSDIANGSAYWIRWEPVHVSAVQVFTCAEADSVCVLWRGAMTFNVHRFDPHAYDGLDIGAEVDVFTFGGADKPTPDEAAGSVADWFAAHIVDQL